MLLQWCGALEPCRLGCLKAQHMNMCRIYYGRWYGLWDFLCITMRFVEEIVWTKIRAVRLHWNAPTITRLWVWVEKSWKASRHTLADTVIREAMEGGNRRQNRRNHPKKPECPVEEAVICISCEMKSLVSSSSVWSLFLHCFKQEYSPKGSCESWFSCCCRGWRCHPKFQEERFKKLNPQGKRRNDSCKAFRQVLTKNEEGSENDIIFVYYIYIYTIYCILHVSIHTKTNFINFAGFLLMTSAARS